MNEAITATARSKDEAIVLIETQAATVVDLDYVQGGQDVVELGVLGRKCNVAVEFRAQELIAVESMRALLRGLCEEKDTFRQRLLCCCFDLQTCTADDLKQAEARAAMLGDVILPHNAVANPYATWAN